MVIFILVMNDKSLSNDTSVISSLWVGEQVVEIAFMDMLCDHSDILTYQLIVCSNPSCVTFINVNQSNCRWSTISPLIPNTNISYGMETHLHIYIHSHQGIILLTVVSFVMHESWVKLLIRRISIDPWKEKISEIHAILRWNIYHHHLTGRLLSSSIFKWKLLKQKVISEFKNIRGCKHQSKYNRIFGTKCAQWPSYML